MRRRLMKRYSGGLSAAGAVLLAASLLVSSGSSATAAADAASAGRDGTARTVTLVTGDRVTVSDGSRRASVERGPGRAGVDFVTRTVRGHLEVVPTDAIGPLQAGRLDPRLFDVTTLLSFDYDDRNGDLPLLVSSRTGVNAYTRATLDAAGARVGRELAALGGFAVRLDRARATAFWTSVTAAGGSTKVWLDGRRTPALDTSVPQIGAPAGWQAGLTGTGVVVAVLDSGIDDTHPDLAGRVAAEANFTDGYEDDRDLVGHGTHVASVIAGTGAASGGRYRGVAPDARLASGKVCAIQGCLESWILAGMQWAAADQHARIVNLSLGTEDTPELDPVEAAVNALSAQYGTLFVVAAGNAAGDHTVGSPGSADAALTVGAVTKADELAPFSSQGPRLGDGALKPDLTAPGGAITAARGKDSIRMGGQPGDPYVTASGTSMAAPHVAGAAALLAQQHPDWTGPQLKAALIGSAEPNPGIAVYAQGAGRVDVGRAIGQALTADPPSVSLGQQRWPHTDDPIQTRTVTYRNGGTGAVTLNLAVTATGPGGTPAPAGMFTLDRSSVTVPAGGTAGVTLTANTRAAAGGLFGGRVTATAGDLAVQTAFAVELEAESYDLTLTFRDRAGKPTGNYLCHVRGLDNMASPNPYEADGTVTVRLPKGRYQIGTYVTDSGGTGGTLLVQPELNLDRDQSLDVDARLGKPISVTVPEPGAAARQTVIGYAYQRFDGPIGGDLVADSPDGLYTAQLGPQPAVTGFTSLISGEWVHVNADGGTDNSPYAYHLAWYQPGRMPTGLTRRLTRSDLATVHAHYAQTTPGSRAEGAAFNQLPGVPWGIQWAGVDLHMDLPFTRNEHYNTDNGVQWQSFMTEEADGDPYPMSVSSQIGPPIAYQRGRTYDQDWNKGVFGPVFPAPPDPVLWVTRTGDKMSYQLPWYGDSAGREGTGGSDNQHSRLTLFRDGVKLCDAVDRSFGECVVPAADAEYRLELEVDRGAPVSLSTHTMTAWTFRSAHVDGAAPRALPLSAIRYLPALDAHNAAPAGQPYRMPLELEPQPGSTAGTVRALSVEVSYDDGATWTPVVVQHTTNGGVALLRHPVGAAYVSLRGSATDAAGNTVRQSTIRAYRLAP